MRPLWPLLLLLGYGCSSSSKEPSPEPDSDGAGTGGVKLNGGGSENNAGRDNNGGSHEDDEVEVDGSGQETGGAKATEGAGGAFMGGGGAMPDGEDVPPPVAVLSSLSSDLSIWPDFDPEVTRYALRMEEGAPVELEVETDIGVELEMGNLSDLSPGDVLSIVAIADGNEKNYEVIILPPDFPTLTVTTRRAGVSEDPLYLALPNPGFLVKLDSYGVPLFFRKTQREANDFKKHPNGLMSYAENQGGNYAQVLLDANYNEVEDVVARGIATTDHHEFLILENGHRVTFSYEPTTRDVSSDGGEVDQEFIDGIIQVQTPEGKVVSEWNTWNYVDYNNVPGKADYAHINSLDVGSDGHWLVSARAQSQILKVDAETGEVLWRLGGVDSDFKFADVDDEWGAFCGQHTPNWTSPTTILMFDNGSACTPPQKVRGKSRVVEYEIDEESMTAREIWTYTQEGIYAFSMGSAQRLDNGNTLIGWGSFREKMVTEVTPDGTVVFELEVTRFDGAELMNYRALKFPQ